MTTNPPAPRNRRPLDIVLLLCLLICGCAKTSIAPGTSPKTPNEPYRCGVHYFADAWPINFWSASHRNANTDFAAIRKDGFNTIILVIPWSEFQPGISPVRYNERSLKRLTRLLKLAKKNGLQVALRLGYTWDFHPDAQMPRTERLGKIFTDLAVRTAWFAYVKKIADTTAPYENVSFGFLTWEDYWSYGSAPLLPEAERLRIADELNFPEWVTAKYSLSEIGRQYSRTFTSASQIPVPPDDSLAEPLYLEFYDELLIEKLYKPTRARFPRLTFEVRVDGDPILDYKNRRRYYSHKKTYDLPGGMFTTAYFNPAFGADNKGDVSDAKSTLKRFNYLFTSLREGTRSRIFLDQFNFVDNTPGYEHNTRLAPEQIPLFLQEATGVFREFTNGYALWAYHDYAANELHNPAFVLGTEGWQLTAGATISTGKNSSGDTEAESLLELTKVGAAAFQKVHPYQQYYRKATPDVTVRLRAQAVGGGKAHIRVTLGSGLARLSRIITVTALDAMTAVTFPESAVTAGDDLRVELVDGKAVVREAQVYHFVQAGGVYHLNKTVYPSHTSVVALNQRLLSP